MESASDEVLAPARRLAQPAKPRGPASVDVDLSIAIAARYRRECELLACRMHDEHPDVPLVRISELVQRADDELAESRVQSFKLILVERAVRRALSARPCVSSPADR